MEQIKKLLLLMLMVCSSAFGAITDGKFGVNQIFDVQYYWSGNTLHASNFIAPYDKNFQTVTVSAGQYFQFFASTTDPGKYGLGLYNSDGSLARIVHDYGDITALGDGAIFYIGSGFFGNVISTAQGYNYGASATFENMDRDVTSADLNNYTWASTEPLAAGQTAAPAAPPLPTFTQLKFGRYQIADTQWNVSACLNTTTCQIYSKQPGVMYKIPWTQGQWNWQPGQYVQFSLSGDPAFPYVIKVYNSDGSEAGVIGTGKIVNMGSDFFFFIGDDNDTGQLFSMTSGMSDTSGVTWTGTLNPTQEQVDAYAAGGSTSPLGPGETAGTPSLCCGGSAAQFDANANFVGRLNQWNNTNISGDNAINITQIGNYNSATVQQSGGRNFVELSVAGHNNISTITQSTSNSSSQSNYIEATVIGNDNNTQLEQTSTGQVKGIYATVIDDGNSLTIRQQDAGGHYAEINLSGGNKTVDLLQQGNANHMARITLSGGQTSITATQSGSTQQYYSIDHNCAQSSCAAIAVTQGQ
jgi:hypothetical protein